LQHVPGSYISEFNGVPTLVVGTDEPVFPPGPEIYAQMISDNLDLLVSSLDGAQTYESAVAQSTSPVQDSEGLLASTEDASQHSTDVQVNVTKIPRPPNAYILYRRDKQPDVKKANPGIKNNEICESLLSIYKTFHANFLSAVITGDMWNNESRIVRAHYSNLADELKSAFYAKHPDYKYNPRRPEEVKRRAKRNPNNATRIQKKVKGRVGTQRKVLVGELEESDLQIFQSETEAVSGGHSSSSASDEIADKRLATVNVVVANQASLNMQLDINEWNKSISDSQSDLDLDLDNLFDNTDLNSFSPPTAFDFGNPNEFPSVLGNGIDDITF
jgi:hypothetical protein